MSEHTRVMGATVILTHGWNRFNAMLLFNIAKYMMSANEFKITTYLDRMKAKLNSSLTVKK